MNEAGEHDTHPPRHLRKIFMTIATTEGMQPTSYDKLCAMLKRLVMPTSLIWKKDILSETRQTVYQLVDTKGNVLAEGMQPDLVSATAYRSLLGQIPSHLQSRTEFADNSILIPVRLQPEVRSDREINDNHMMIAAGPGSAGEAALAELRSELAALFDREYGKTTSPDSYTDAAAKFVERSVAALLLRPFKQDISGMRVPGGRNLIFARDTIIGRTENIFAIIHGTEVEDALMQGKFVPDHVLRDCPHIADQAPPYQLTFAQYLACSEKVRTDVGNHAGGFKVAYRYLDPAANGPFTGTQLLADKKARSGDQILGAFGLAVVTSVSDARANLTTDELTEAARECHFASVRDAIDKHIPIAPEVLSDYPALQSLDDRDDLELEQDEHQSPDYR